MRSRHLPSAHSLRAALFLTGLVAAFSTNAQEPPARLGLCASCHGERGVAIAASIPNLAGQNLDYLRNAVLQYQSGARDVPAMRAATAMLGAADLERVLQWYAAQPVERRP